VPLESGGGTLGGAGIGEDAVEVARKSLQLQDRPIHRPQRLGRQEEGEQGGGEGLGGRHGPLRPGGEVHGQMGSPTEPARGMGGEGDRPGAGPAEGGEGGGDVRRLAGLADPEGQEPGVG
jgi:hypothetical protein